MCVCVLQKVRIFAWCIKTKVTWNKFKSRHCRTCTITGVFLCMICIWLLLHFRIIIYFYFAFGPFFNRCLLLLYTLIFFFCLPYQCYFSSLMHHIVFLAKYHYMPSSFELHAMSDLISFPSNSLLVKSAALFSFLLSFLLFYFRIWIIHYKINYVTCTRFIAIIYANCSVSN